MAKTKTSFKKGQGGKKPGSKNKTTRAAKELILLAIDNQVIKFNDVMEGLQYSDPKEWARLMVKMFDFVLPKQLDLKSDGQPLIPPVINVRSFNQDADHS